MNWATRILTRCIFVFLLCGLAMQAGYLLQYGRVGRQTYYDLERDPQRRALWQTYGLDASSETAAPGAGVLASPWITSTEAHEEWALRRGRFNGVPYESAQLITEQTVPRTVEHYRRRWGYRGMLAHGQATERDGQLVGAEPRTGRAYQLTARRIKDEATGQELTQLNQTILGPVRGGRPGMYYPQRLPRPRWPEGLLVSQSQEDHTVMTSITWGEKRSLSEVNIQLLRGMWAKGWKEFHDMPATGMGLFTREFYDLRGGQCTLTIIPAERNFCTVQLVARWPGALS